MATYTMQELEHETAELLPARETLNCYRGPQHSTTYNIDSGNGNYDGNGDGNGFIPVLSGDLNGDLDGNTVVLF
jgi:hypothetical protein